MPNRRRTTAVHRQRGFTLSEILVTTAIFAIIMIAALAVYDQSNKVFKTSTEAADMQQSTRIGFEKLISDVRMAGFDYNRGGTPTNSWEAPQPDEQIEYAGPTVFAFRANFNYATAASTGNGLEPSITPYNTTGQAIFPYVTTNNSEIVIYALRSADSTKNTGSISFYVDDYTPRSAFPSSITPGPKAGTTSHAEALVTLDSTVCATCGIDITNANPPYTLYRVTVADILAGQMGTPVAENIRSLNFHYYTDGNGQTLLTNPDGTAIATGRNGDGSTFTATNTGAIGGAGQYDPNSVGTTANYSDRDQRAKIQSIKVDLVGMNANPDLQGYTNPNETLTAYQKYREYGLSSLVVPRNLGKTGFPEPVYAPPAAPTITGMCTGYCGSPVIYWAAPVGGGPVESYTISWDNSPTGAFAAPHTMNVDPSQTSATLPDDGTSDVSVTWYYRISAVNSNGSSPWSSLYSVTPQNNTKPQMKTDLHATDTSDSTQQSNQITLTWTSPTDNNSSLNTLSCSGTGGSTNGSKIPSVESSLITYRIWRGTTQNFDSSTGTVVLAFTGTHQPAPGAPGSGVTWVDNTLNDSMPPANCVQYYYRVQAANRCRSTGAYNASGNTQDAISDPYPPWGTNAIPGSATSTATPVAPAALVVNSAASACPGGGSPTNCSIQLQWNKVTADTGGNAIGVDTYTITRYVKHQNNIPSNGYTVDTTFGTSGSLDVSGFSQVSGSTATWTDTTAPAVDPGPSFPGSPYSYQYVVAAKQCGNLGAVSNTAVYPAACTINPTIIQCGATGLACGGAVGGDTPSNPWVMNAGDQITVQQPAGVTITSVQFNVTNYPTGTPVDSQTVTTGVGTPPGFIYTWVDRTAGAMYQVTMVVTTNTGCQETHIKYVQEQTPAPCAFANIATSPAVSNATSGSTTTLSVTYTVPNNGTDVMNFHVTSPAFDSQAKITWADPTSPSVYSDIALTSLTWNTSTDNFTGVTSPTTRTAPSGFFAPGTSLAAGASFSLTVRYQYNKNDNSKTALTTNPTQKLCISYRIPSEPNVTKFCNLVGQAASTNNPNSCD